MIDLSGKGRAILRVEFILEYITSHAAITSFPFSDVRRYQACHSLDSHPVHVLDQRLSMFGLVLLLLIASVGAGPAGTAGVVINRCADGAVPHEYMVTLRSPGGLHTKDDRQLSVA